LNALLREEDDMTDVEEIKTAILKLTPRARAELRQWYEQIEAEAWDQQIEADVQAGRLDQLASEALQALRAGMTSEL
jgi:hypothetical protein